MCIHLPSSWRAVCLRVHVSTHSLCAHVVSMYQSIYLSVFLSVFVFQNAYRIMCVYIYIYMQNMYTETKGLTYYLLCSHLVLLLTSQPILKQKNRCPGVTFFSHQYQLQ